MLVVKSLFLLVTDVIMAIFISDAFLCWCRIGLDQVSKSSFDGFLSVSNIVMLFVVASGGVVFIG